MHQYLPMHEACTLASPRCPPPPAIVPAGFYIG